MEKYLLYWHPRTSSIAPHIILEEIGVNYETQLIDIDTGQHKSEWFLKINPYGYLPVLLLEDGSAVSESAGIVMYLADKYHQTGLAPRVSDPDRAEYNQWLFFLASVLYPSYSRHNHSHRFSSHSDDAPKIRKQAAKDILHWWQVMNKVLNNRLWILGDRFSACDLYLFIFIWSHVPHQIYDPNISALPSDQLFEQFPNVKRIAAQLAERPAVNKIMSLYPPEIFAQPSPYK